MEQQYIADLVSLRKGISHKNQNYWIERLASELPLVVAKASGSVNPRKRGFNLDNPFRAQNFRTRNTCETEWEGWCLDKWSIRRDRKTSKPINGGWDRLVARQVPLEIPQFQRNLFTADLLGIAADGYPVVIELKGHIKQSAVLALILQALDYGIRLRESWVYFYKEWQEVLLKYNWPTVQSYPHRVYLVCAAPSDVWKHENSHRLAPNLTHYSQLKKTLDSCGFPLSLASLSKRTINKTGLGIVAKKFDFKEAQEQ